MKNRPKLRLTLFIVSAIVLVWVVLAVLPKPQSYEGENPFRAPEGGPPHIIAHAGGNMEFPDNTLEAHYNAYSIDPNVILETDVAMTADGVVVLTHDLTFDRKTNLRNAPVEETSYHEVLMKEGEEVNFAFENEIDDDGFQVGDDIPYTNYRGEEVTPLDVDYPEGVVPRHEEVFRATTLEEFFRAFPDNEKIVEVKPAGERGIETIDTILELMDDLEDEGFDMYGRVTLASFHKEIFEYYMELKETTHPELLFSPQDASITNFYILHWPRLTVFYDDPVSSFQVPMSEAVFNINLNLATRAFVNAANRHNIAVHYWTINEEEKMRELVEVGADGILTDRPTLLREVIEDYFPDHFD